MKGGKRNQFWAIIRKAGGGSGQGCSSLIKMICNCTERLFCFPLYWITTHISHQSIFNPWEVPNGLRSRNITRQTSLRTLTHWDSRGLSPYPQSWEPLSFGVHQGSFPLSLPYPDWGEGRLPRAAGQHPAHQTSPADFLALLQLWVKLQCRAILKP